MNTVISRTLGGLAPAYYIRQFIFGAVVAVAFYFMGRGSQQLQWSIVAVLVINTVLYPYSRFVYESIVDYILGDNVIFWNAFLLVAAKVITMFLCWLFAVFIAPLGLAYLYYHHSKAGT